MDLQAAKNIIRRLRLSYLEARDRENEAKLDLSKRKDLYARAIDANERAAADYATRV